MHELSVVIITLDEERDIGRCIESVRGLATEVVVVDSLSRDRTREIAASLGATVVEQPFLGYVEQKNFAVAQARHGLVLSLDADEALSEELRSSVKEVLESPDADGWVVNRLPNYCGRWIRRGGWYPDRKLRLFRRGVGAWSGTNPHDRYVMPPGSRIRRLSGDLLHYTCYTEAEHLAQIERFSEISANEKWRKGVRSSWWKLLLFPAARFVKGYFLKLGFLDGRLGWVIARNSAYATYLRYRKILRLQSEAS